MAPEVLIGEGGDYDSAADVYSLSLLTHELLSGAMPFGSRNDASMVMAIAQGIRPERDALPEGEICDEIMQLLEVSWATDSEDRPSAEDISNFLEHHLTNSSW
eukprot:TRINITY_DN115604_c0_g1_i1.p1 TRINITY_DN115604_c0_g1~~TRINITY_DN115604_c0_g1_i1.p1  ORF type:complete len:103 (-),score=19.81 TRINITY_DN115604_c0_g1_i1:30-338(-)